MNKHTIGKLFAERLFYSNSLFADDVHKLMIFSKSWIVQVWFPSRSSVLYTVLRTCANNLQQLCFLLSSNSTI